MDTGPLELITQDHMLTHKGLAAQIAARAAAGGFGDEPASIATPLGEIILPDKSTRRIFIRHAADAVLLDGSGNTILITRLQSPGRGKLALPGGFLDKIKNHPESSRDAALREAMEETGIRADILSSAKISPVGPRLYTRPFDVRCAYNHLPGTDIHSGEFFIVSTRAIKITLPVDLRTLELCAGDDAGSVQVLSIAGLTPDLFAVPDHLALILQATQL